MMFSGKKEKALEEELAAVRERDARRKKLLSEITEHRDDVSEQFARMTASRAQAKRAMEQMEAQMKSAADLAESSSVAADEVHNAMIEMNNAVGTFEVNHTVFVGQVKDQNEKIKEIVENNKHFTGPVKYLTEAPPTFQEEYSRMLECIGQMREFSKSMGVLALNAAIEAGRMGESGEKFISAAEEIRTFSENYDRGAAELSEQLKQSAKRVEELSEQVHQLSGLIKENNISMGRLMQEGMQHMAAYESGQLKLRELLPDTLIGRADALQQSQKETAGLSEQMLAQAGSVREELSEQKSCADELENIYKGMQQSAGNGLKD